jgi:FMN phosphatase YigB (HAD superfamily)
LNDSPDSPGLAGLALDALVAGVRLFSLDAGNTVIFLDHARIAQLLAPHGIEVTKETIVRCEGEAKRLLEDGAGERPSWAHERAPGAASWGKMIGTILVQAGVDRSRVPALLEAFWKVHMDLNLWWLVPDGLGPALDAVRAAGVPVVIVSNSEGMLDVLFARLGLDRHFDLVVDSGKVGIEKPDPGIWQIALAAHPAPPDAVLHLGDTYATDIAGAKALGYRAALIDPFAHYEGRHAAVTRVPGVVEVAHAIVRSASRARSKA